MRLLRTVFAGLAMALLLATGATAGSNVNEVGALGVFPVVVGANSLPGLGASVNIETFLCITNASASDVTVHVSAIDGQEEICTNGPTSCAPNPDYCYECNFEIPMTGNDTECLVVRQIGGLTTIESEDHVYGNNGEDKLSVTCGHPYGMVIVNLEDGTGQALTDNVLLGSQTLVDYTNGVAFSIPMVPFQGKSAAGTPGDRTFAFDGVEYEALPRIVAADFIAPQYDDRKVFAGLALFTPGFDSEHPPQTDCSVTLFDAEENPISDSFQFGCWTFADVCDINPEFCYPYLGQTASYDPLKDSHGWFQLSCRVDQDPLLANGYDAHGGVHGALVQVALTGEKLRSAREAGDPYPPSSLIGNVAWARLLYQSVTVGEAVTLHLSENGNNQGGVF